MKTKKAKTASISDKLINELQLMVKVGATPIECVNSFNGKISRSTVYKLYNKIKTEADGESTGTIEEVEAVNVLSEVTEEPVSEIVNKTIEQFEEELKHGDIVEHEGKKYKHVYTGRQTFEDCKKCSLFYDDIKCFGSCGGVETNIKGYFVEVAEEETENKYTECDTESAHIINELSAKNEELQKELHTSKNVIATLQKMTSELNEAITESKCMIHEICKERDEKAEEIRVLNLELQELKNKYDSLEECNTENWSLMNDFENELNEISKSKSEETGSIADFRKIIEEMIQLYIKKNKDYGDAFKQSYNEFGNAMCAIRINDKLNRFKTLIKQNNEVKTESIKDTLIDLANYAVMTIIEIEQEVK